MTTRLALPALAGLALAGIAAQQLVEGDARVWTAAADRTVAALFAALALLTARRRIADRSRRRPWDLLAWALAIVVVALVIADVYVVLDVEPGRPSGTDIAAIAAAVVAIVGITRLAMSFTSLERFVLLDTAALLVAVAAIAAVTFYDDAADSSLSAIGQATMIALCVVSVMLAIGVLQALVMTVDRRRHPELWLILAGTCAGAIAFVVWTPQVLAEGYVPGREPIEALWSLGLVAMGGAGLLAPRAPLPGSVDERSAHRGALLPAAAFFAMLVALAVLAIGREPLGARLILVAGAGVVGALFSARFALLSGRYLALLDREREIGAALARASRELDRFFELAPVPLSIAGLDGYLRRVNPEWTRVLGWSAAELTERPFLELVHPDDRPATSKSFARIVAGHSSIGLENRYRAKDGSYRWFRWHATPVLEEGLCYAAAADITAVRAAAEERLAARDRGLERVSALLASARSQADLESALGSIAAELDADKICLSVWRPEERIVETLAEAGEQSGETRFAIDDFGLTRRVVEAQEPVQVLVGDPGADRAEVDLLKTLGHSSLLMIPVVSGGETVGLVESYCDAEREWTAGEVDRAWIISNQFASVVEALNARRANQAKSEFLSRMSHELRTPLNVMLGFAQLLELDTLPSRQASHVRHILRGGQHLLELVNEVLDISRAEAGELTLSPEPVDLQPVIVDGLSMVAPLASERGVELRAESSADVPCFALADRHRLEQVLLNLLSNAIKYNRDGGWVSVGYTKADGRIRLSVADSGPGIPAEAQDRLFEPFDRLGAEHGAVEGTGLGLALAKRLTEAMGGAIEVASERDAGAVFTVELKAAQAPQRVGRRDPMLEERRYRPVAGTVLSIEDNPANLALMDALFAGHAGVTLLTAIQGQVGLDLAREHLPDLVLLDLHLPDMHGEEVLRRLRSDEATREIPVIVVSADATSAQIEQLRSLDIVEYLTKPLDVDVFERAVEAVLGERGRAPA